LELAASESARPSGSLTLPAISAVFTVTYVAEMLGEDEDWLHELSIDMFPEDSCLRVYGVGKDGVTAFTDYGIECLKQHHHRRKDRRQSPTSRQSLRCSPHADVAVALHELATNAASTGLCRTVKAVSRSHGHVRRMNS
jgi:hypothetical protein